MAELSRRLCNVIEEIRQIEKGFPDGGEGHAKILNWRVTCEDVLAILDSGRLQVVDVHGTRAPRRIAVEVMKDYSTKMRWGMSPEEWVEFVDSGGLYGSVIDAVMDAWRHAGYEVVKNVG